ncbi:hypothetical protein C0993_007717 [Termitomyces sp. T159_Od127]|nr:hypothetical protein C0993_007717 [Termitomyces sp. T159_Od127]
MTASMLRHNELLGSQMHAAQSPPSPDHYATPQSTEDAFKSNSFSAKLRDLVSSVKNLKNVRVHAKHAKQLAAEAKKHGLGCHPPRPKVIATHVTQSTTIQTDFASNALPHESFIFGFMENTRHPSAHEGKCVKSLKELQGEGYKLIEWDGITSRPIVCRKGQIFGVLVGQPDLETGYGEACHLAYEALSVFDPKKGSHFVLHNPKLIIKFLPGVLILTPSAALTHANLPVAEGESRMSFPQYCGGGIFCYVVNRYCMETELQNTDPKEYARINSLKKMQWEENLKLYSTFDSLKNMFCL